MALPIIAGTVAPAAIGALGQVATGLLGGFGASRTNAANAQAAKDQMAFQQRTLNQQMQFSGAQAKQQMDFQERMSNTSYQRQVADLKAAGLNPALAYQSGGADSAVGAAGTVSSAQGARAERQDVTQAALSSALSLAEGLQRIKLMQAQESSTMMSAGAAMTQAYATRELSAGQIRKLLVDEGLSGAQTDLARRQSMSEFLRQDELRASSDFWKALGRGGTGIKGLGVILQLLRGMK